MQIAIALAHIVGAVTTVFILSLVLGMLILLRNEEDVGDEDPDGATPKPAIPFSRHGSQRRPSSAALIQKGWAWIGLLMMLLILVEVLWSTVTQSLEAAKYAWIIVAVFIGCELAGQVCSMVWRWLMSSPQSAEKGRVSDTV